MSANSGISLSKLAFIALGSNLGDSYALIRRAFDELQNLSDKPLLKSSLWQTAPVDCPPGSPMFVNAAAGLVSRKGETPESLLHKLQAMEIHFGRATKKVLNEARPLDLDIIAFAGQTRNSPQLVLPHPRAHQRGFVLQPLAEIAHNLILPGQTKTVLRLLGELPLDPTMKRVG